MKKVALFAFQGEVMCFAHVLLNAFEMKLSMFVHCTVKDTITPPTQ